MYEETKGAVRKAFEIGKVLFSMGGQRYNKLLKAVSKIKPPVKEDLSKYLIDGMILEDALIAEMRERYKSAALSAGFTEQQGIAMLEYAAMLEELKDDE